MGGLAGLPVRSKTLLAGRINIPQFSRHGQHRPVCSRSPRLLTPCPVPDQKPCGRAGRRENSRGHDVHVAGADWTGTAEPECLGTVADSGKTFHCAQIATRILISCALFAALRFPPQAGRFASLSSQGTARFAGAGIGEAMRGGWAGLWAGTLHTLCGPDHLAGLTPLTLGQNQAIAAAMGALWGFGHSSGQLILGLAFMLLKERFHGIVPVLSKWSGAIVGSTLIGIGLLGVYESLVSQQETHGAMEPVTMSDFGGQTGTDGIVARRKGLGTYMMGFVYGLHPDALFVVLPALALPTRIGAFMYISMFVIGTVAAMGGYSLAIGTASEVATKDRPLLLRHLSTIAGSFAILVGVFMLITGFGFATPA